MLADRTEDTAADSQDLRIEVVPQLKGSRIAVAKYGAGSVFDATGLRTLGERPRQSAAEALIGDRARLGGDAARSIAEHLGAGNGFSVIVVKKGPTKRFSPPSTIELKKSMKSFELSRKRIPSRDAFGRKKTVSMARGNAVRVRLSGR